MLAIPSAREVPNKLNLLFTLSYVALLKYKINITSHTVVLKRTIHTLRNDIFLPFKRINLVKYHKEYPLLTAISDREIEYRN